MTDETVLNPAASRAVKTVLNREIAAVTGTVRKGTLLDGKYLVTSRVPSSGGEADLYLCQESGRTCVAKIYRRRDAVKPEIFERLALIKSDYVAPILAHGEVDGRCFEISPYYRRGSLSGKKCTYDQLRVSIIPALAQGLKALHDNGIIHKDLKPSNIMLSDDGKHVVIIDFGISSVREGERTIVVTQTGMTPVYTAPEGLKGAFLIESDYYSLGVTLYELFVGKPPYAGMTPDEMARYASVQRIPCPSDMPGPLRELIGALTYVDLTNRADSTNPNRRWGYREVGNWLKGIAQPLPGATQAKFLYVYNGKPFGNPQTLAVALAMDWDGARREMMRGDMYVKLQSTQETLAEACAELEKRVRTEGLTPDGALFEMLYTLHPKCRSLYWKGRAWSNLACFGGELLASLRRGGGEKRYDEMLVSGVLSRFCGITEREQAALAKGFRGMETRYHVLTEERDRRMTMYTAGFLASGRISITRRDREFFTADEMAEYMKQLLAHDPEDLVAFCHEMVDESERLDPETEAWLTALGHGDTLAAWKKAIQDGGASN